MEYLDEFGDRFWCETDERVRQITEKFVDRVTKAGELGLSLGQVGGKGSGAVERVHSLEERAELVANYQQIVNDTQLPRLNEMIVILDVEILDSSQHFTYLVIDDLDKEWIDEALANTLIRCLLQAVVDMQKVRNLKILVALRTNIFQYLDYGSRSQGGQEEKLRGLAIQLGGTRNDLRGLLEQRVEAASEFYDLRPPTSLAQLLPNVSRVRGNPTDYVIDRTLLRPRDAILFMNECIRGAAGKRTISWTDILAAESEYSRERLDALRDEWKNPYPGIEMLIERFRQQPAQLTFSRLKALLDSAVIDLLNSREFTGNDWLSRLSVPLYSVKSDERSWDEMYEGLVSLLYEIGFLGLAGVRGEQVAYSFLEGRVRRIRGLTGVPLFEIHPAFRRGLETRVVSERAHDLAAA